MSDQDAQFKLLPLNDREAQYYPPGSMELRRRGHPASTPQVWVVTPNDIRSLFILTSKEMVKRHEHATGE